MKFVVKNMKFAIKNMKFSIQNMKFSIKTMKISIKNMKLSIKNMKFSVYKVCQNSSFVLFITEFSYHMYRKNAFLNGKQKQMKPLLIFSLYANFSESHICKVPLPSGRISQGLAVSQVLTELIIYQ